MPSNEFSNWRNMPAGKVLEVWPDPVILVSSDGIIVDSNQTFVKLFGTVSDQLNRISLFDVDENLSRKAWKDIWKELGTSNSVITETSIQDKKGTLLSFELSFSLVTNEDSPMACVFIKEISNRKKLEQQLQEAEFLLERIVNERSEGAKMTLGALKKLQQLQSLHESILQSAGNGIYGLDSQGRTTFVNAAAAKMVGWTPDEQIGKSQHQLVHHSKNDGSPYDHEDCPIYAALKDGKVHHEENEVFWRKDGSSFPVEYISTPIWDENKKIKGAVVSFKDITWRKEAELTLEKTNKELEEALNEVRQLKQQLEQENEYLQQEIKLEHNFEEIISQSKEFKKVLSQIEQVACTNATVLILGESGTGKELVARAVHNISNRKDKPLVKVNCAALPASLIESELFGHEKGAFTGALSKKIGRFELAHNGTIFLDEIGELPLELQSKLLRVLQEGEFERLGHSSTKKVDVRIIAATNRNLETEVEQGNFREDLYYRLNVFPLELPPLRDRKVDVPLLAQHFIQKYGSRFGKNIDSLSSKAITQLTKYNWPGNVRELENIIERAIITCSGSKLTLDNAFPTSKVSKTKGVVTLDENERSHILKVLESTNWKVSGDNGAAKILDIKRTTLEARMKKLGIRRP